MRKSLRIIPALLLFAAIGAPNAHADTFAFTVTGLIGGTLNISTASPVGGTYLGNGITGTFDGLAVTGLIAPGGFAGNDNLLTAAAPYVDALGVAFATSDGTDWELFARPFFDSKLGTSTITPGIFYSAPTCPPGPPGTTGCAVVADFSASITSLSIVPLGGGIIIVTPISAAPEPPSILLLCAGLLGLLVIGRSKFARSDDLAQ
jgi:hypothetical protein